jgi:hypothetical protein
VVNNSTGAIVSADVTASSFIPSSVGPFTINSGISAVSGLTQLVILDAVSNRLTLAFPTLTPGSLVGYTGSALSSLPFPNGTRVVTGPSLSAACLGSCDYFLSSGSLTATAIVPVPEP